MTRSVVLFRTIARGFSTRNNLVWSGHNKWSTIKHDKAKNDAERNKLFSKFAQRISLAVKLGGGTDPQLNIRLATAIEQASKNNVTKKVIENAIKKGSGQSTKGQGSSETCVYEGMGPGGVAFVVEALTDNKNRTVGLVRSAFTKAQGSMTPTLYFFDRQGYVVVRPPEGLDEDRLFDQVLELDGVQDLETLPDGSVEVVTTPQSANSVASSLRDKDYALVEVGVEHVPKQDMCVSGDEETKERVEKFLNVLSEIEDVTDVYHNLN